MIKDAKRVEGLLATWQKDDKFWIELAPEDFGREMLLAPKIAQGIGEAGLFGGSMSLPYGRRQQLVEFRRVHNQVQLIARNTDFTAPAGTPEGRAVQAGFSPSLIASTVVASQPHPERKSVLIEANALFLNDLLGLGMTLQRAYRQGYGFDGRNSAITAVRGKADQVVFEVNAHFATASLAMPQPGAPGPMPSVPMAVPDARSLFFGLQYALARLPEQPMQPRRSDPRVGYFDSVRQDFGNDLARTPRVYHINRWRLEKKDPTAALSEPVKPITYWLDRTIPVKYRDAISKGILAWNDAFERIGFKNAIVVKVQPDDADFDTLDVGVASVRWMTNAAPTFGAIGPSQIDPRSGEILDADIGFESLSSRSIRALRSQVLASRVAVDWPALMQTSSEERLAELMARRQAGAGVEYLMQCQHADFAAEQLSYALDVLEARGELDPASPEAQAWVLDYLTDTTMHEVGHTLGLRHNFRSSRVYTEDQLADPEFTLKNGLAGSVMEYAPINLGRPGDRTAHAFQLALGPYDYWAIEYGYKPIAPDHERDELLRIASRSAEPQLAYGTDEDNFLGIDPESLHFDLGSDPVAFAKKRFEIARDLIRRQETRELKASDDYSVLRRSIGFALRDAARASGILARQIGGVRTLRDFPGSGRDPLLPVSAAAQREALDVLARGVLAPDAFVLSSALQRRLAPSYQDRRDAVYGGEFASVSTDYSLASVVLDMQRALLGALINDSVAQRLLDSESKGEGQSLRLSELYQRVSDEVWSELELRAGGGDIVSTRRELQREYTNRLTAMLLRPSPVARADARSLVRAQARELLGRIQAASQRKGLSAEARAHLQDSADTLRQALAAPMQRAGA